MLREGTFHGDVAYHIASGIVVQESVEADALDRGCEASGRREGLESATGTDAHHGECAMLVSFLACLIVDISQGVAFVDDDVDIVAPDTMALTGDALSLIRAGDGMELATGDFAFLGVEMGCYGIHTGRVAHEDNLVSQLFGFQMKVEARAVAIDNQFGFGEMFLSHSIVYL